MKQRDDDMEAMRRCPYCGDTDVPHLIVRLGNLESSGLSWRCRSCGQEWSNTPETSLILARPKGVHALTENPEN
jgi:uncharacterized Zn finger protein